MKWPFFANITKQEEEKRQIFNWREERGKIERVFLENALLIIRLYWPNFCFPVKGVSVCKKDFIRKNGEENPSLGIGIVDRDGRVDNLRLGKNTPEIDKRADYPSKGINTSDRNRKANNLGTSTNTIDTNDTDREADDPQIY